MSGNAAQKYDAAMRGESRKDEGLVWYSPKEEPFHLAGLAWFAADGAYYRMPKKPKRPLPEAVVALAAYTAGVQARFQTDSARISIRVTEPHVPVAYHIAATCQRGFDCYAGAPGAQFYSRTARFDPAQFSYESPLFGSAGPGLRNFTINFPPYGGVTELSIGLDAGSRVLAPPPYAIDRPVVAYGTSITMGGCASRPGIAWTNILGRRLNIEVVNLGFSGSGKGEPEVAETIAEIPDPACFILDYEANAGGLERLRQTLPAFISILRERHRATPILVVSGLACSPERFIEKEFQGRIERRDFQRGVVEGLRSAGDKHIFFQDGGELLGKHSDECTVDGQHPTDLGFMQIANGLEPTLRGILRL